MRIRFWGSRGSLPTPGPTTLRYGGNTTCVEIRLADGRLLIIDAGSGLRFLGKEILAEPDFKRACILLTHSHWDHLLGFPFFAPAYSSKYEFDVCGGPEAQESLQSFLQHQMEPPYFPVSFEAMKAKFRFGCRGPCDGPYHWASVESIALNHPDGGYGFKITDRGRSFVFLTDNEIGYPHPGGAPREAYVDFCRGVDILVHDCQYTDEEQEQRTKGWGHSTFTSATDFAIEAGAKRFGLFHHDPDRSDEELDHHLGLCKERIARAGASVEPFIVAERVLLEL